MRAVSSRNGEMIMKHTLGKRGFVTIATGADRYYDLAVNLLHSYRFHSDSPYPFAILCDRENDKTAEFDDVIILDNPSNSYNDKLRLFDYLPYRETIFIDADSLAYGDLNAWWDMFAPMGDFSVFGYAYRDLKTAKRWFRPDGMREFADQVSFVPDFNGGVYYLRRTETCGRVFELARWCAEHYHDYAFDGFVDPADEPVLALGMAVCGCEPLDADEVIFAPKPHRAVYDIVSGRARRRGSDYDRRLIHWSNYLTMKSAYRFEKNRLDRAMSGKKTICGKLLYDVGLARAYLWIYDVKAFCFRVKRKIKKVWKKRHGA